MSYRAGRLNRQAGDRPIRMDRTAKIRSPTRGTCTRGTDSAATFFISIILGSAESDLYWSVGTTFIQIIDESVFIHPNVCTFIQNRTISP
jgi:hypothetical protein